MRRPQYSAGPALREIANARANLPRGGRVQRRGELLDAMRRPCNQGVVMHFGIYLKKKGVITAEQLVAALGPK